MAYSVRDREGIYVALNKLPETLSDQPANVYPSFTLSPTNGKVIAVVPNV